MKPKQRPRFTAEQKAYFKSIADQVRAKRETATQANSLPEYQTYKSRILA